MIGIKYSFADNNTTLGYLAVADNFSVLHGYDKLFLGLLLMQAVMALFQDAPVFSPEPFVNMYRSLYYG